MVDLVAREPDLDTAGLKCHLSDQGHSGVLGEIFGPEVYVHGRFARPEGSLDEARNGVQDILKDYRRRIRPTAENGGWPDAFADRICD